ncbi:MAG: hypothetical protein KJ067_00365 [Vicinamibacteria bacterium]|nr:hypothetical protein [Vicinamibacteria bacterium]
MKARAFVALLAAAPLALAQDAGPERNELQGLASVFEQSLRETTRPGLFTMGFDAPRSFYLPGVGAVIVLSPRALPVERRPLVRRRLEGVPYASALRELEARRAEARSPEEEQALAQSIANLRRLQELHARENEDRARAHAALAREAAREAARSAPMVADVRELERQVLAMQEEAERSRREAEAQLERLSHEVRLRMPLPPDAPPPPDAPTPAAAPAAPGAPAAPAAPAVAPPAPWAFWFEVEELDGEGTPEATLEAVRATLVRALETQGPRLRGLAPQEGIVVAVDLVAGGWPGLPTKRRTLVARVARKDLDARAAGKLAAEEFAKKVQLLEY